MKELRQKIEELTLPILAPIGAFLIDVNIANEGKRSIIQVFVDTDTGISIDQCAETSRRLSAALDLQNIPERSYILQVSSPGLEKPLHLLRQYHKNIGRNHKVRFRKDEAISEIRARLASIDGEHLTFITDKDESITIHFKEIVETTEQLPW